MEPDIVVPVFLFLSVAVIWGGYILTRHKERLAIIEKGLKPEEISALFSRPSFKFGPLSSLKWGLVFVLTGIATLIALYLEQNWGVSEGVYPGLIILFAGLGLVIFYVIARRQS